MLTMLGVMSISVAWSVVFKTQRNPKQRAPDGGISTWGFPTNRLHFETTTRVVRPVPVRSSRPSPTYGVLGCWRGRLQFLEVAVILLGLVPTLDALLIAPRGEGSARPALTFSGTALLTVCSQTVRMLLDVAAHVRGKHAGQAHHGGPPVPGGQGSGVL